jgi:hypothetical protein
LLKGNDDLKLSVTADKPKYAAARKSNHHYLNAKNAEDKPASASFSAAVIDMSKVTVDETAEETIFLTSSFHQI